MADLKVQDPSQTATPIVPKSQDPTARKKSEIIPDSWDAEDIDDDDDEVLVPVARTLWEESWPLAGETQIQGQSGPNLYSRPSVNKKVWEAANKSEPTPQVILGSRPSILPPTLDAPRMILKRPTEAKSGASPSPPPASKTMAEREAEYKAARERIFASSKSSDHMARQGERIVSSPSSSPSHTPKPASSVLRNPAGPSSNGAGFKDRGRGTKRGGIVETALDPSLGMAPGSE